MSIVAMKRKAAAKTGISSGGAFTLNGSRAGCSHAAVSVKSGGYARRNHYKRNACFNGQDGFQCERVWDGKKMATSYMASGESISQEEYISRKRHNWGAGCKDLILRASNVGENLDVKLVDGSYVIEFGGKTHAVHWNKEASGIAAFIANGGDYEIKSVKVNGDYKVVIENNNNDLISFKNPVITDYGIICINDKVVNVNKGAPIEPLSYDGVGGYIDKVKQPMFDASFCHA